MGSVEYVDQALTEDELMDCIRDRRFYEPMRDACSRVIDEFMLRFWGKGIEPKFYGCRHFLTLDSTTISPSGEVVSVADTAGNGVT